MLAFAVLAGASKCTNSFDVDGSSFSVDGQLVHLGGQRSGEVYPP